MVTIIPIAAWAAVLVATAITLLVRRKGRGMADVADVLLRYVFLFPIGLVGLWAFMGHVFFAAQAAASIGWQTSPFQYEVGMANLGIGVTGVIAAFAGRGFRWAVALMTACFLGGAGVGHILDIADTGNTAPGNAGPILYSDFLAPALALILLVLSRGASRGRAQSIRTTAEAL